MNSILKLVTVNAANVIDSADDDVIAAEGKQSHDIETMSIPDPAVALDKGEPMPRRVLVVEDTIELAEIIVATLERINIQTFHETHVKRALSVYESEHPTVILLDIGLPDKTGWKLLDAIKQQDADKQPRVIVITAHGDPANRLMGKLQGVYSYLVKPFTPDEVELVVGRALANAPNPNVAVEDADSAAGTAPLPDFIQDIIDGNE